MSAVAHRLTDLARRTATRARVQTIKQCTYYQPILLSRRKYQPLAAVDFDEHCQPKSGGEREKKKTDYETFTRVAKRERERDERRRREFFFFLFIYFRPRRSAAEVCATRNERHRIYNCAATHIIRI